MEDIFEGFLGYVNHESILNCKLVCKTWNAIVANPRFWLKKLKIVGLPQEVYTKWMKIQNKFEELEISKGEMTKALEKLYIQFMTKEVRSFGISYVIKDEILVKSWLSRPPIVVACTLGLLDVVKILAELNENFDVKYPDTFYSSLKRTNYLDWPIFFAMAEKKFEVVDFILTKMTIPLTEIRRLSGKPLFHTAAEAGHLNLVKRLLPMVDVNELWEYNNALHFAIRSKNNEVVEFLAPFYDVNVFSMTFILPLHLATIYENADAVKILVPITNSNNLQRIMQKRFTSNEFKQIIHEEIKNREI